MTLEELAKRGFLSIWQKTTLKPWPTVILTVLLQQIRIHLTR